MNLSQQNASPTGREARESLHAILSDFFFSSENCRFSLWKGFGDHPFTIGDGLCAFRALLQLERRFDDFIDFVKKRNPTLAMDFLDSEAWNEGLEKIYLSSVLALKHREEHDTLTDEGRHKLVVRFQVILNSLQDIRDSGMCTDRHTQANLERLLANTTTLLESVVSMTGQKVPRNFSVGKELWMDLEETALAAFHGRFPILGFRNVGPHLGSAYMELYITNRLLTPNNALDLRNEVGGLSYPNLVRNLERSVSNVLVYINGNHFVVHDIESPMTEKR
jgi:hypothetical protein